MRFAVLGRTEMLLSAAEEAVRAGHEPVIVATCPAAPEYQAKEDDFARFAKAQRCPFILTRTLSTERHLNMLRASGAAVAISMNWMTLLRRPVLDVFPHGVINAHAGDLPRYRGNACPNWAILNGERRIGICLHRMDEGLDTGDIFLRRRIAISDTTYIGDIYAALRVIIPQMFVELLNRLERGTARARPQSKDPSRSLRCFPRLPRDGLIDWNRTADDIGKLVRASSEPFSGAYTHLDGKRLTVWRAAPTRIGYPYLGLPGHVVEIASDGSVVVLCGQGALRITLVDYVHGVRTCPAEVISSTRTRLGVDLAAIIEALRTRDLKLKSVR